ncbi:MAG: ABC transporter ATP-binding protein [Gemmatimonadota bacterium]
MAPPDADDLPPEGFDSALLRRLIRYLRPHRRAVMAAVALLLLHAVLVLAGPILTERALDRAIPARDSGLLARYAALFVGALLLTAVVEYFEYLLTVRVAQRVMFDLRNQIFTHLQRLSVPFFDANPVGRLMTRVTNDVETLNELFQSGIVTAFGDLFTLVAISVMMVVTDWRLALVAFAVIPVIWLVVSLFRRRVRSIFREIRARVARLNAFLQEHLSGVRVLQLFGREAHAASRFDAVNRDHLSAHLRSITLYAVFFPMIEVLTTVAVALLLLEGGRRIIGGGLTVGVLAAFIQLTRRFFQPLQDLSEKVNLLQSAMASSERVFRLLDTEVAILEPAAPKPLPKPVQGQVVFEGVWFRYAADGPWVLRDVSFRAEPGETVALVGHTGAGKTTIISLLLRFYDPERGRITLDGVDIRELALAELRRQFGFVQQDLFLFAGDIERNIKLDAPLTETEVRAAAARVGADRFIDPLPSGYRHVLTERGRNLSVGERQLLSFARALAQSPTILLLDEATSSVDSESEALIQRGIAELMADRTALVVAHRLSTVQSADRILVLHHGEIVEQGRHEELLAREGLYERLYRLQTGRTALRA